MDRVEAVLNMLDKAMEEATSGNGGRKSIVLLTKYPSFSTSIHIFPPERLKIIRSEGYVYLELLDGTLRFLLLKYITGVEVN